MNELIPKRDSSLDFYKHLLLTRDSLLKDAFEYECEFNRTFGDAILEIFRIKIECIRKKKIIAYYQQVINRGGVVDNEKMQTYINEQMKVYEAQLKAMIKENEALKKSKTISAYEVQRIKKIYHEIARKIHPDINPAVRGDLYVMDLWERVVTAYRTNCLKDMEELEVLVDAYLEGNGTGDALGKNIIDIEKKIKAVQEEINTIKTTDPYMYRCILEDDDALEEKKTSYEKDLNEYREYSEELSKVIRNLLTGGGLTIWQMN